MDTKGMTALVTGANRGIGRAIAQALAGDGASVLAGVRALDQEHGIPAQANLRAVRIDLSSRESIESSVAELDEPVDILVNNAGVFEGGCSSPRTSAGSMSWCSPRSRGRST